MKHRLPRSAPALGLLATLLVPALPGVDAARADFRVCNDSASAVSIAFGYRSERGWQSLGWWVTSPNDCAIVYDQPLTNNYYYVFAIDESDGGSWGGSVFMCTRDNEAFTVFGVDNCVARGYERTGFLEVVTEGQADWTLRLVDADETEQTGSDADADVGGGPDSDTGSE